MKSRKNLIKTGILFISLTMILQTIATSAIEVNATDNESGKDRVEFYGGFLGTKMPGIITEEPYNLTLKRDRIRVMHIQKLKVIAYDKPGNGATAKIIVRKIL